MKTGRDFIAAAVLGATWGTAVAAGAGNGVLLTEENLTHVPELLPDDSAGQAFIHDEDQGLLTVGGTIGGYMRYIGLEFLLAAIMGTAGSPSQQAATAAYEHVLAIADDLIGIFGSLAFSKGYSVFEYPSVKFHALEIRGEAGQPLRFTITGIADDRNINTSSGTNNNTTIATVTVPESDNRILFRQGVWRINAQDGAAIDDDDKIYPSAFTLTLTRQMERVFDAEGLQSTGEPGETAFPEAMLRLEFPKYAADTYLSLLAAKTNQKADIVFTGALIEDTYYRGLTLEFPNLVPRAMDEPGVSGASRLTQAIEFNCRGASSAPTGMSGITLPFQATLMSTLASDPLA